MGIKMNKIKFSPSYLLLIGGLVLGVLALILYLTTGKTQFTPTLSTSVIVFLIIGIVSSLVSVFFENKYIKYVSYWCFLFAFLQYILAEITYISNIFVSIDGTSFSFEFIITFIALIGSFVCVLISANMQKDKIDEGE